VLFNSLDFLLFFPVVTLIYFLIPHRVRYLWLLGASYYFYMCWNPKYALLMLTSTAITYASGLLISSADRKGKDAQKKLWVGLSFGSNLAILFFFKYFDFLIDNLNQVLKLLGITLIDPGFSFLLPVGISFYTFQALSYTMDVYRKDVAPEKNFLRYALFVSFFPQLVAGPIERSSNLLHQLHERHYFDSKRVASGLLLMLWGFFQKMVIADRAAYFVDMVYNYPYEPGRTGFIVVIATVLFAIQIYCDFSGYSDIAIGCARILGIDLMDNFRAPYLAHSIREFWSRWHISLSTWFRDYVYIPLGGNRSGVWKQRRNLLLTFLLSGLWHGANWTFVLWGLLHGGLQVVENLLRGRFPKLGKHTELHGALEVLCTFTLVCIGWIFFRANNVQDAFYVFGHITDGIRQPLSYLLAPLGMLVAQKRVLPIILFEIALLLGIDTVQEKRGIDIALDALPKPICLLVEFSFVCLIALLAVKNTAAAFIYFQF